MPIDEVVTTPNSGPLAVDGEPVAFPGGVGAPTTSFDVLAHPEIRTATAPILATVRAQRLLIDIMLILMPQYPRIRKANLSFSLSRLE
jgi:hypothetical protein